MIISSVISYYCSVFHNITSAYLMDDWGLVVETYFLTKILNSKSISFTYIAYNVFEHKIRDDLTSCFGRQHLPYDAQHTFNSKRSCLMNFLSALIMVTHLLDNEDDAGLFLLDFSKNLKVFSHAINGTQLAAVRFTFQVIDPAEPTERLRLSSTCS